MMVGYIQGDVTYKKTRVSTNLNKNTPLLGRSMETHSLLRQKQRH